MDQGNQGNQENQENQGNQGNQGIKRLLKMEEAVGETGIPAIPKHSKKFKKDTSMEPPRRSTRIQTITKTKEVAESAAQAIKKAKESFKGSNPFKMDTPVGMDEIEFYRKEKENSSAVHDLYLDFPMLRSIKMEPHITRIKDLGHPNHFHDVYKITKTPDLTFINNKVDLQDISELEDVLRNSHIDATIKTSEYVDLIDTTIVNIDQILLTYSQESEKKNIYIVRSKTAASENIRKTLTIAGKSVELIEEFILFNDLLVQDNGLRVLTEIVACLMRSRALQKIDDHIFTTNLAGIKLSNVIDKQRKKCQEVAVLSEPGTSASAEAVSTNCLLFFDLLLIKEFNYILLYYIKWYHLDTIKTQKGQRSRTSKIPTIPVVIIENNKDDVLLVNIKPRRRRTMAPQEAFIEYTQEPVVKIFRIPKGKITKLDFDGTNYRTSHISSPLENTGIIELNIDEFNALHDLGIFITSMQAKPELKPIMPSQALPILSTDKQLYSVSIDLYRLLSIYPTPEQCRARCFEILPTFQNQYFTEETIEQLTVKLEDLITTALNLSDLSETLGQITLSGGGRKNRTVSSIKEKFAYVRNRLRDTIVRVQEDAKKRVASRKSKPVVVQKKKKKKQ